MTVHRYDVDWLRPIAGERHQQHLREADANRLARASRATRQRRRWLRFRGVEHTELVEMLRQIEADVAELKARIAPQAADSAPDR